MANNPRATRARPAPAPIAAPTPAPAALTIAQRILSVARSQLGVSEQPKGSNDGTQVRKYLASVGIGFPAAWCMAFVYWCVDAACREAGRTNPLTRTGGVLAAWRGAKSIRITTDPRPGDIFIMDYGRGLGHAGFVERVTAQGLLCIEGNTNDEGSREGFEVCRRTRTLPGKVVGYIRIQ